MASYQQNYQEKPISALHHSPHDYATDLITDWLVQLRTTDLPVNIQDELNVHRDTRNLRLMPALLNKGGGGGADYRG